MRQQYNEKINCWHCQHGVLAVEIASFILHVCFVI